MSEEKRICQGHSVIANRPCMRKATNNGIFCAAHKPGQQKKRKPHAKKTNYLSAAQRVLLLEDCLAAVRHIAAGNVDPMRLCKNVLSRFDVGK